MKSVPCASSSRTASREKLHAGGWSAVMPTRSNGCSHVPSGPAGSKPMRSSAADRYACVISSPAVPGARPSYRSLAISATTSRSPSSSIISAARRASAVATGSSWPAAGCPSATMRKTVAMRSDVPVNLRGRCMSSSISRPAGDSRPFFRGTSRGQRRAPPPSNEPASVPGSQFRLSSSCLLLLGRLPLVAADRAVPVRVERAEILTFEHRELHPADQPVRVSIHLLERRLAGRELAFRRAALRLAGRLLPRRALLGRRAALLLGQRVLRRGDAALLVGRLLLRRRAGLLIRRPLLLRRCATLLIRRALLLRRRAALLVRRALLLCAPLTRNRTRLSGALLGRRTLLLGEPAGALSGGLRRALLLGAVRLRAALLLPALRLLIQSRTLLLRRATQRVSRLVQLVCGAPQSVGSLGRALRARLSGLLRQCGAAE